MRVGFPPQSWFPKSPGARPSRARPHALDRATVLFYALLTVTAGVVLILPLSSGGRQTLVEAHQLRSESFPAWAALQFVPSMYNYAHRVWISEQPLTPEQLAGDNPLPPDASTQWVNHYPTRMMTFGAQGAALLHQPRTMHYYFDSRFGSTQVCSHYTLEPVDNVVTVQLLDDVAPAAAGDPTEEPR